MNVHALQSIYLFRFVTCTSFKKNPSLCCALFTAQKPVPSGITPSLAHQQLHCMGIPCSGIILGFLGSDSCISEKMQVLFNHIALPNENRKLMAKTLQKIFQQTLGTFIHSAKSKKEMILTGVSKCQRQKKKTSMCPLPIRTS